MGTEALREAMTTTGNFIWVRSLLAIYRQAARDAACDDATAETRQRMQDALDGVHHRFSAQDDLESLWRDVFGASENGVRAALAPLAMAAEACSPESPMRALVEFAAEEIAFFFDGQGAGEGASRLHKDEA